MTRLQFSRAIKAMLSSVVSLPDELWVSGFPTVSVRCGDMEAYIGLRPASHNGKRVQEDDEDV